MNETPEQLESREYDWARKYGVDFDGSFTTLKQRPYWISLAWKVVCPQCDQRVALCMKRKGKKFYYQYHSLKDGGSGFVNPMVYRIQITECPMSHKVYTGQLPLFDGEGQLRNVMVHRLAIARREGLTKEWATELIKWLRDQA